MMNMKSLPIALPAYRVAWNSVLGYFNRQDDQIREGDDEKTKLKTSMKMIRRMNNTMKGHEHIRGWVQIKT
jgi:hypothetical protein